MSPSSAVPCTVTEGLWYRGSREVPIKKAVPQKGNGLFLLEDQGLTGVGIGAAGTKAAQEGDVPPWEVIGFLSVPMDVII